LCGEIACGNLKIGPQGGVIVCAVCGQRRAVYNPKWDKACHHCRREYNRRRTAVWKAANPWSVHVSEVRRWQTKREYHLEYTRRTRGTYRICWGCGVEFLNRAGKQDVKCEECRRPLPVLSDVTWSRARTPIAAHPTPRTFISARCEQCGGMFVHSNERPTTRFCSPRCRTRAERRRHKVHHGEICDDPEFRRAIFKRDRWICHLCGESADPEAEVPHPLAATIDHVEATANGGIDTFGNVLTAHFICNSRKRDLTVEEYRARYAGQRPSPERSGTSPEV